MTLVSSLSDGVVEGIPKSVSGLPSMKCPSRSMK